MGNADNQSHGELVTAVRNRAPFYSLPALRRSDGSLLSEDAKSRETWFTCSRRPDKDRARREISHGA